MKKADLGLVRAINYDLIWDYFLKNTVSTIPIISDAIGLSLPTVTRAIEFGMDMDMISAADIADSTGGRKARKYRLNSEYMYFLLLILDNERIYFEVRDFLGNILKKDSIFVVYENILVYFESLIERLKTEFDKILCVSVSITGVIDTGVVVDCCAIGQLNGFNLKEYLENRFKIDVIVENNVKALTNAVKKYDDEYKQKIIVAATFGHNGYGFGFLIDGRVLSGARSAAGEISYAPSLFDFDENPQQCYENRVQTIASIFNPDIMVMYCGDDTINFEEVTVAASKNLPEYLIPRFIKAESFTADSFEGLNMICTDNAKRKLYK